MRSMLRAVREKFAKSRNRRRIDRQKWHRRFSFEQFEPRQMLANTDTSGAFSVLLDNAPGDVNGFDGNLALYQSGLVYNSKTVADTGIQIARQLPSVFGNPPTSVSATLTFNNQSWGPFHWDVDAGAGIGSNVLYRVPLSFATLDSGRYSWSLNVTYTDQFNNTTSETLPTSYISYVNRADSEFGKGWYHKDLAKLKVYSGTSSDGLLLVTGDGEPTWFQYSNGQYLREAGDQRFYTVTDETTHFRLTDKFGSSKRFLKNAPSGWARLESEFDVSGNERRFWYDANHKLQSIQHMPTGNSTAFTYDTNGFITTITENIGTKSRWASVTTALGQLMSIALPDPDDFSASGGLNGPLASPLWQYAYNGTSGLLTKTTDPVGNISGFTYGTTYKDAEAIVSIQQGSDSSTLVPFTTSGTGSLQSWNRGTLNLVADNFGQFTDELGNDTWFGANATGFITQIKEDNGAITTYDRNADGLLTRIVTPDPDGPGDPTLVSLETTYEYDPLDPRGNVIRETKRALGSSTVLAQQTWEYSDPDYSLPTKQVDELGRVTKYTIGAKTGLTWNRGKVLSMTEIVGIDDILSTTGEWNDAKTTFTYYQDRGGHVGLLDTITDPLGRATKHQYFTTGVQNGLLSSVTYNNDGTIYTTPPLSYNYEYDDFRNRKAIIEDPTGLNRRTEFQFDNLDRLIKRTDPDPDAGQSKYVSSVTQFAYDPKGNLIRTTDPMFNITRSIYDQRNRPIYEIAPPAGSTTAYTPIDDEDIGFSMSPNWIDYGAGYNGDYRYHNKLTSSSSDYAQWEFGNLDAGKNYEIFITWPVFPDNAWDAPHEILDSNNLVLKSTTLDERFAPDDETVGNVAWERLGVFAGSTGYKVKVRPSFTGYVGADAVRIVEVGPTTRYEYDAAGNLRAVGDALNNKTQYQFDNLNRVDLVTPPPGGGQTSIAYWNDGAIRSVTDPLGTTNYKYDQLGRNTEIIAPDPDGPLTFYTSPITSFAYNAAGELTSTTQTVTGSSSRTTSFQYDDLGRQTQITQADGSVTKTVYNKVGNPVITVDSLGNETIRRYDALDRLVNTYDPVRDPTVTPWRPAPVNNHQPPQVPSGWTYYTDPRAYAGDYIQVFQGAGGSNEYFTIDVPPSQGRMSAVMATWVPGTGNTNEAVFTVNNAAGYEVARVTVNQKIEPDDYQDETGRWWEIVGVLHNLPASWANVYVVPLYGTQADAARIVEVGSNTIFGRDKVGNLTSVTDNAANTTTFTYDALNRLTTEKNTSPLNKTRSYEYDPNSRLTKQTDRLGRVIEHIYDNLGRPTSEVWPSVGRTLSFSYDANGRLLSASDPTAINTFTYDALGRPDLATTSFTTGLASVTMNADWDPAGFRTQLLASVGGVADFKNVYTPDALGRVAQITQQAWGSRPVVNKRVNYEYNSASEVTKIQRHRNLTASDPVMETNYGRDDIGRATSMAHSKNFVQLAAYTSTFDAAGRMTGSSRSTAGFGSETATYGYDRTAQLTSKLVGPTTTESYVYDPNGNRAVANGVTYTNTSNNRIWKDGTGYEYVYDDEGNIIAKKVIGAQYEATHYVYDHRNRMTRAYGFNAAGTLIVDAYYSYDALDRRVIRSIDPDGDAGNSPMVSAITHYDGDDVVLVLANDATGTLKNRYLHGPAVDEVLADENWQGVLWALPDQFQNVRDLVDHSGTLYNHLDYDTFGKVTYEWKPASGGHRLHAYGFQSRERDQETQLNFHRSRYYNPSIGRWLSEDPIGFGGGDANLNRFVGNSPTNFTDPYASAAVGIDGQILVGYFARNPQDGPEPSFGSVWWTYIFPWNNPPAVDGWDTALTGGKWAGAGTAVVAGSGAAVAAYGTGTVVAAVGQEVLEGTIEATTGITLPPLDVVDIAQAAAKQGIKRLDDVAHTTEIIVDSRRYPASARHLEDAGATGRRLVVNRSAAAKNRADALRGQTRVRGMDLDEAPPAVLRQPGDPVSVQPILPRDNRGAGASIGNQLRGVLDGAHVIIRIRPRGR